MTPVPACGAAIFNGKGELLLVLRKTAPEAGHWSVPGGKVDWGEPVRDAVRREVAEELGVEIALSGMAVPTETILPDEAAHYVAPVFEAHIASGSPKLLEPEKHAEFGWFDLARLPSPLAICTREYLEGRKPLPAPS